MKITVNGQLKELDSKLETLTLTAVIEQLGYHPRLIVVEFNGTISPPSNWDLEKVQNGDQLEVVTIVGGGS